MMKKILIFVIIMIMIIPNLVGCKRVVNCYTLQDAYEKGLITKEELVSIAYYWNKGCSHETYESIKDYFVNNSEGGVKKYTEEEWNTLKGNVFNDTIMGDNFTPIPKTPEELSDESIDIIKNYIAEEITSIMTKSLKEYKSTISDYEKKIKPYSKDDIQIDYYFGTYSNLICIICNDAFSYGHMWFADVTPAYSIIIDDVIFFKITGGHFITCYEIK